MSPTAHFVKISVNKKPNANVIQRLFENTFFKTLSNESSTPKLVVFLLL